MTSKPPDSKRCAMCGRRSLLVEERLAVPESEHSSRPAPPVRRYYTCQNPGCEYTERAA